MTLGDVLIGGADGCRAGWLLVWTTPGHKDIKFQLAPSFAEILKIVTPGSVLAVDMPVGLLEVACCGGRECDRLARGLLQKRRSSVFSPPIRNALRCSTYAEACHQNKSSCIDAIGISVQAYALRRKLLEIDEAVTPQMQDFVFEAHPELSFYELNERRPMPHAKKSSHGLSERRLLLSGAGFAEAASQIGNKYRRNEVSWDDILDACICCWTAKRIFEHLAIRIPEMPQVDNLGKRMEIWR